MTSPERTGTAAGTGTEAGAAAGTGTEAGAEAGAEAGGRTGRGLRAAALAGPLLVLSYCVANAVKSVVEGRLVQDISPEFYAFNAFLVTQLLYLVICRDPRALAAAVRRSLPDVVAYNVTTTLSWVAVLYALQEFEPAVANSLIVGMVPILTILIGGRLRPQARPSRTEILSSRGVLASMGYLAVTTLSGSSGAGSVSSGGFALGLVACVVTAAAVAGNTFYTKRLGEAGMRPGQMMACRFPLLLVSTLALFLVRDSAGAYTGTDVALFVALGLGVAGTLLLLQMGITRTEPMTVALLFGSNLILTFGIQFFDPRLDQSLNTLIGVLLLTGFVLWGSLAGMRR